MIGLGAPFTMGFREQRRGARASVTQSGTPEAEAVRELLVCR